MELDIVKLQTTWNDAASSINANFSKIKQALTEYEATAGATYVHTQNSADSTWVIVHSLGRFPSVTVVDSAGSEVVGDVTYDSDNQVTVRFTAAFSGKAYLN